MNHSQARKEFVATRLYEVGAFKDKSQSPSGEGFRLKLHQKHPDAPLSPFYVDLRVMQSYPDLLRWAARLYGEAVQSLGFDLIAPIPIAATPLGTLLSSYIEVPMVTPREPKDHGTEVSIDGHFEKGQTALLVDDLITAADSKIAAAKVLEGPGLVVRDVVVLIDRQQGGKQTLAEAGYRLHFVFTLSELLDFYLQNGSMSPELYTEIRTYAKL